jgi:putative transposase
MNNYNPNIHHRHSIRLKGYDYSQAGLYFITICVQDRKCLFGEIVMVENFQPSMVLNDAGKIAVECWLEIPKHFPNAVLHKHIVMPNHVHGIIELIKIVSSNVGAENFPPLHSQNDSESFIGVQNIEPLQSSNESLSSIGVENFQPQRNEYQKIIPHSIGSIVRGFKTGVTKWFRNNNVGANGIGVQNFEPKQIWQRNYYEHIIRDEKSYYRISEYIIKNPKNWKKDDFFNK